MAEILIVDDSPTVGSTVQWILHNQGHSVQVVRDGLAALSALAGCIPDLILLDIRLPHVDGVKLCEMIRNHSRLAHVPIVMLSGLSNEESIQGAYAAGANDYMVKPINDAVLLGVINEQLGARSAHLSE
ncbi:MAG: response regulator [Chloroflexi bacterium]|nr:response regulator [Chloroflexota bacterium]